ncbi:hypothetical protein CR513_54674, partial [Mucuna pruriens]
MLALRILLLEAEFPKLFWSLHVVDYINLMLQDMEKLEEVSEVMSHTSKLPNMFIIIALHCI